MQAPAETAHTHNISRRSHAEAAVTPPFLQRATALRHTSPMPSPVCQIALFENFAKYRGRCVLCTMRIHHCEGARPACAAACRASAELAMPPREVSPPVATSGALRSLQFTAARAKIEERMRPAKCVYAPHRFAAFIVDMREEVFSINVAIISDAVCCGKPLIHAGKWRAY